MDDRRQDEGRTERNRMEQGSGQYGQGQRTMTTQDRQGSQTDEYRGSGGRSGDWQGYVVPYRYYGPGYRGVGYYSVFYQGSGDEQGQTTGEESDAWNERADQMAWSQGGGQSRSGQGQGQSGQAGQGQRQAYGRGSGGGSYAGRGPKGYQRSDERLREDVSDRLMEHHDLDAGEIEVDVRNGEVTLTGSVPDRWMKRLAEDLAERVMGVRDVMNQIRVGSGGDTAGSGESMSKSGVGGSRSTSSTGSTSGSTSTRGSGSKTRSAQPTRSGQEDAANGQKETASTGDR